MQELKFWLLFFGMVVLVPILFGLAYIVWDFSNLMAITLLFIGLASDLLIGLELLDLSLSHS